MAGTLLPPSYRPAPGYIELRTVSPSYIGFSAGYGQPDEYAEPAIEVHRVSDGSRAPSLTLASLSMATANEPRLSGTARVQVVPAATASGPESVEVRDLETGVLRWSRAVPVGQQVVDSGASWALTVETSGQDNAVHLLRPDAPDLTLTGITSHSLGDVRVPAADAHDVLLHQGYLLWSLDIATGTLTQVASDVDDSADVELTPQRVFWVEDTYIDGSPRDDIQWVGRDGSSGGRVLTEDGGNADYLAFGNRVAATHFPVGAGPYRADLDPVDLVTGRREAPVATGVATAKALGNGTIAAVVADSGHGHVTVLSDDGTAPRRLTDLPPVPEMASKMWLSGTTVVGDFGDPFGSTGPTLVTSSDGSSPWRRALSPGDQDVIGGPHAYSGGSLLAKIGSLWDRSTYRVSWSGGHRDVEVTYDDVQLGRQGLLLTRRVGTSYEVQSARSGAVLATLPDSARYSVDGTWVWQLDPSTGVLTGRDVTTGQPTRSVTTGVLCKAARVTVAGRWALLTCTNDDAYVVDLLGGQAPWKLPQGAGADYQLGNGFVANVERRTDATLGESYAVAVVHDLAPSHGARVYGPLHGRYTAPPPAVAVDDGGEHRLVYLDTARQVRRVDLTWLQRPTPAPDRTAPVLRSLTGTRAPRPPGR